MTEIKQRLQDTTKQALEAYDTWMKDHKNEDARQALIDMVHELRKVTSRLEMDIVTIDRNQINAKPMPIPEHKSKMEKRKNQKPLSEILPVAEIKESMARKIEIEEANAENDIDDTIESEGDATEQPKNNESDSSQKPRQNRRPRRKKTENGDE